MVEEAILMMLVMGLYDVEGVFHLYLYSNALAGHTELKPRRRRNSMDSDLRLPPHRPDY